MKLFMSMMTTMLIIMSMTMMFQLIMEKSFMKKEKLTAFECGFNLLNNNKIPFSTNFFLITIMFLMFDLEFSLLMPSIMMQQTMMMMNIMMIFFITMTMILMMEWYYGMMEWSK
uniref:NADH-ubiquinone oxidoreductase chain 3 n=1 Tax=Riccardoella tokyoensis TaxID=2073164 RepID=A0A7R7UNF2_9ACAR|nr:NADH dehydrogenase subunit 3 [Riccardoella tokyoensis]